MYHSMILLIYSRVNLLIHLKIILNFMKYTSKYYIPRRTSFEDHGEQRSMKKKLVADGEPRRSIARSNRNALVCKF